MIEKVYALGGSVISEHGFQELAEALETEEQIAVVTGAGDLKKHIKAVEGEANQAQQDNVGIHATRLNAKTLQVLLDAYPSVPRTHEEVLEAAESGKSVVLGGLTPGFSTDAVSAIVAELFDAKLFIATDVEGVYDRHPEEEGAERFEEVSVEQLRKITRGENRAGDYSIIDSVALDIIERSEIPTKVFKGEPDNLEKPGECAGTSIVSR